MLFDRAWMIDESDEPLARDRLDDIVAYLTRQKWRQLAVENSCAGLFWGLTVSAAVVIAVRLTAPGITIAAVVASLVGFALAAALLKTWIERPDKLQVAILADLELKLKQRLSTAWEFAERGTDPALSHYLAEQAVKRRYPSRHHTVFPARATVWVKLVPLVTLLLLLVSVLDLPRLPGPTARAVDDLVVTEGKRLREFARQMQVRAEHAGLPRSAAESENIRRLGARMESGSISRTQSLHRLQNLGEALSGQRRAALTDAGSSGALPDTFTPAATGSGRTSRLRDLFERLLQGQLTPGELDLPAQEAESLSAAGIAPDALREALVNFAAGEPGDLQQLVEELSRFEQAMEDAEELGRASERVARVRENLGDPDVQREELRLSGTAAASVPEEDDPGDFGALLRPSQGENYPRGMRAGSGTTQRQRAQYLDPRAPREEVGLRPQSQFREGSGFTTQTRILPRAAQPSVAIKQIDPRFAAQMEEVFAREQYPLHHKEFIRRYFLELSQGVAGETSNKEQ
ncbi:MAG: hypothetical protein OET44_20990 [Gammaproteobacteria bacterium]|nr:hypothetical protein [Gammaproteobacteria bacterium]